MKYESITASTDALAMLPSADLVTALDLVAKVKPKRNSFPILECAYLHARGNGIVIRTTDLDLAGMAIIDDVLVDPGFAAVVPVKALMGALKGLDDGDVTLIAGEDKLTVQLGDVVSKIDLQDAADFPLLKSIDYTHSAEFSFDDFSAILNRTAFAMSTEETRFYLNGIYFNAPEPGRLEVVATDGHRMGISRQAMPSGFEGMPSIIVPSAAIKVLQSLKPAQVQNAVLMSVNDQYARFQATVKGVRFVTITKLINASYPVYSRVVPTHWENTLTIERDALLKVAKLMKARATGKSLAVRLEVQGSSLTARCKGQDCETAISKPCESDIEDAVIGLNVRYLYDLVNKAEGDTLTLILGDGDGPVRMYGSGDDAATYVQMPMRL
ncbi:MAG: DNA polymerase III subunit beta [Pseudomonadota bacterium]